MDGGNGSRDSGPNRCGTEFGHQVAAKLVEIATLASLRSSR